MNGELVIRDWGVMFVEPMGPFVTFHWISGSQLFRSISMPQYSDLC